MAAKPEPDLCIRPATARDLQAVVSLERAVFATLWSPEAIMAELSDDPRRISLLAELGGRPVGYAFCWRIGRELHLASLGVLPEHRRRGVGRELLESVLRHPGARGATRVTLEVRMGNRGARAFYEGQGFRLVAIRPRYYPDTGEDALVLLRELPLRGSPPAETAP